MKRIFCILLAAASILSSLCLTASAEYNDSLERDFYSDCAILVCSDNDEIIFSKNINKQSKPASMTKVVTASIVLENCKDLSQQISIPEKCIRELDGTGSSLSGLKPGETVTVYDLLCCLLIPSANDAATTLADFITGEDRQAFIDKMNELAKKLGCKNSHFVNCHGLDDDDQYTTVSDMVKFLKHAMQYPVFAEIVAKQYYVLPETNFSKERTIRTTNFTINKGYKDYYCPYSKGGKTGSTSVAGHCLCSSASNNGYNYIAVCMGAVKEDLDGDGVDENGAFVDTKLMYDWAFDNLRLVSIAESTKIVGEVPLKFGKNADFVSLSPENTSFGLMPKGIDASSLMIRVDESSVPEKLTAPIKAGEYICKGEVLYADKVISTVDLVATSDIKRSFFSFFGSTMEKIFSSPLAKITLALVIIVLIILIIKVQAGKKSKNKSVNIFRP